MEGRGWGLGCHISQWLPYSKVFNSPSPTLWYMLIPVDSGEVDSIDVPGVVGVGQVTGVQVGVRQS